MQLSTKARYAARAMIELAVSYGEGPVQLREIARRQNISEKYLEQVLLPLRNKGYIITKKGKHGGYSLSKHPAEVNMYDIVESVEGSLAPVDCVDHEGICERVNLCVTRGLWLRLKDRMREELEDITLKYMAEEQERLYKELAK